jgi:undecaprenol kinase
MQLQRPDRPPEGAQRQAFYAAGLKNRPFRARFGFAAAGIRIAARRERSLRSQLLLAAVALGVTAWLRPGLIWCAVIVMAAAFVLALEMVNAALEYLTDHVHPDHATEIMHAKDAAAGAVLLASLGAVGVGALMLLSVLLG